MNVAEYYDLPIDENNDPVHDAPPLKEYMNKWDGAAFINSMELNRSLRVLEIGVGTGRLAMRTAPLCADFTGVDISAKTIERAQCNLRQFANVHLHRADFMLFEFEHTFDVVYSSLTFMHIYQKQAFIQKVHSILSPGGKFVLSIDKNQSTHIEFGNIKIQVFPDDPASIAEYIKRANLKLINSFELEFAHVFVAAKDTEN